MSKEHRQKAPPAGEQASLPEKPPTPPRTAFDLRLRAGKYEVVAVTYADGECDEEIVFASESAPLAAQEYNARTKAVAYEAITGLPPPSLT